MYGLIPLTSKRESHTERGQPRHALATIIADRRAVLSSYHTCCTPKDVSSHPYIALSNISAARKHRVPFPVPSLCVRGGIGSAKLPEAATGPPLQEMRPSDARRHVQGILSSESNGDPWENWRALDPLRVVGTATASPYDPTTRVSVHAEGCLVIPLAKR